MRLLLVRHAKSDWKNKNIPDIDRPLSKRGERDKVLMTRYLQVCNETIDYVYTSPALRACCLAEHIATTLDVPIKVNMSLYTYSKFDLLTAIQAIFVKYMQDHDMSTIKKESTIAVVTHNTAITELANFLSDKSIVNVPTTGIVALSSDSLNMSHLKLDETEFWSNQATQELSLLKSLSQTRGQWVLDYFSYPNGITD